MQFNDIIGQEEIKHQLKEMVEHNRLSHALLFLGKEGSGALPLALAFSTYIMQQAAKKEVPTTTSLFGEPEPLAAPAIEGINLADQYIHPDIHFSYPVIPKKAGDKPISTDYIEEWREFIKQHPYGNIFDWLQFIGAENKQGNITAHECNDIIRKLNLKSFEGGYKILILWMPEYLGKEGNKLLKLIEEPPADTLFILVAENDELILPTILSRCQLVKIPALTTEDISQALIARSNTAPNLAAQIAGISDGNYREALHQLQHADADWQDILRDWLNAMLKNGPIAQVKWIEEISKQGREKQKQFLRYFTHLLELSVRVKVLGENNIQLPEKEKDFALRLNKIAGIEQQQAIAEELDKAAYYIERNANAKMLFHALTIRLYHIIRDKTLILVN